MNDEPNMFEPLGSSYSSVGMSIDLDVNSSLLNSMSSLNNIENIEEKKSFIVWK